MDEYEIYAIRYARHDRRAADNFVGRPPNVDPHDSMPLDYFVWVIKGRTRSFVIDTGFGPAQAQRRNREWLRSPAEGLNAIGIAPDSVQDVIITHMHYDHAGGLDLFPNARFHLQEKEMAFCTGRCMCHPEQSLAFSADDVGLMVHRVFDGRVMFHDGASEIAPGVSLHLIGGHTMGLQSVRVMTRRGPVVLASDAAHLYAHLEYDAAYPVVYNIGDMLHGHSVLRGLAPSDNHIIPGHDPLVARRYPAAKAGLEGIVMRLDADPRV